MARKRKIKARKRHMKRDMVKQRKGRERERKIEIVRE